MKLERQDSDIEKLISNKKEFKKTLFDIYFFNLEENLHLYLNNQVGFLDDLSEKIDFYIKSKYGEKFFQVKTASQINEEFKIYFDENVFTPLENFIEKEIIIPNRKYEFNESN